MAPISQDMLRSDFFRFVFQALMLHEYFYASLNMVHWNKLGQTVRLGKSSKAELKLKFQHFIQ